MELILLYKTQESKKGDWFNEFLIMEFCVVIRNYDIKLLTWKDVCEYYSIHYNIIKLYNMVFLLPLFVCLPKINDKHVNNCYLK